MKILFFGAGNYLRKYKPFFVNEEIIGIIDNDESKIGTLIDGIKVFSPEEGVQKDFNKIIILSKYVDEMKEQLCSLGVQEKFICDRRDIKHILGKALPKIDIKQYGYNDIACKRKNLSIALVGNDLSRTGGPISLLRVAKILKKSMYDVACYSMEDGPMKQDFLNMNVPVIIDANMYVKTIDELEWTKYYDVIFLNGIHCYTLLQSNDINFPIVWWLHDPEMYYFGYDVENLNHVCNKNISVYAVSKLASRPFEHRCPDWNNIKQFLYGIEDTGISDVKENKKIVFAIIGSCTKIKGQDIFIDAIELLPDKKREKCEFWIVGNMESNYGRNICKRSERIKEIKILGELDSESMKEVYQKISVLVSASLEDVMPIVCTEAMMYFHPCIVSDKVGTAEYITHEIDGLIFRGSDSIDLGKKMEWMIDHECILGTMGSKARKIYEKNFSIEVFENALLSIISEKNNRNF